MDIKVRMLIDGLPFTGEGYAKARDLLQKRYRQTSEVVSAYVRAILELPTIKERDVAKTHSFYETLLFNVESLQTLDSLEKLDAAVRFTFDKLDVIKSELAMTNEKWSEWTFLEFACALERWTKNNPIKQPHESKYHGKDRDRSYFVKATGKGCLYCSDESHKAISCDKTVNSGERRFWLKSNCVLIAPGPNIALQIVKARIDATHATVNITRLSVIRAPRLESLV